MRLLLGLEPSSKYPLLGTRMGWLNSDTRYLEAGALTILWDQHLSIS